MTPTAPRRPRRSGADILNAPLEFNPPSVDEYRFDLEDKDAYAKELHVSSSLDGEYDYDYKSWDSAKSAGERAFRNEIESYTGKKLSLPSDFYTFRTKDTEYINNRQDHVNEWRADNIKSEMKPASEFYTCIGVEKTTDEVRVSSWFGDDKWKTVTKYCYYLRSEKMERFYNNVARAAWYGGKYSHKFGTEELNRFHKEITEEWKNKISYLLNQF